MCPIWSHWPQWVTAILACDGFFSFVVGLGQNIRGLLAVWPDWVNFNRPWSFLRKVAQKFNALWALLKNIIFIKKTTAATFGNFWNILGYFYSNIWSHYLLVAWPPHNSHKIETYFQVAQILLLTNAHTFWDDDEKIRSGWLCYGIALRHEESIYWFIY